MIVSGLVVPFGAFGGALRSGLWRLVSGARLAEHVNDQEISDYRGGGFAERTGGGGVQRILQSIPEGRDLGIVCPHRIAIPGWPPGRNIAVGSSQPSIDLFFFPHEAQIFPHCVWILCVAVRIGV